MKEEKKKQQKNGCLNMESWIEMNKRENVMPPHSHLSLTMQNVKRKTQTQIGIHSSPRIEYETVIIKARIQMNPFRFGDNTLDGYTSSFV